MASRVTPGILQVLCCRRGISLRKGGPLLKRTNLTLPDDRYHSATTY
jgi:hypothetical protein